MDPQNRFPKDQTPTSNYLAAAIKNLPTPTPTISPQTVEIDGGPAGRFRVTFVVRQNTGRRTPIWFWGVESGERIPDWQVGADDQERLDSD